MNTLSLHQCDRGSSVSSSFGGGSNCRRQSVASEREIPTSAYQWNTRVTSACRTRENSNAQTTLVPERQQFPIAVDGIRCFRIDALFGSFSISNLNQGRIFYSLGKSGFTARDLDKYQGKCLLKLPIIAPFTHHTQMSHSSNPYAQAGWSNPSNPMSNAPGYSSWQGTMPHAPTYGALPPASAAASPNHVTFQFNSTNGDTLNSTVTDPNNHAYFLISTVPGPVKVTTFSTADGVPFASVEWSSPPLVTIKNKVPRQDATKWLLFSRDRS